MKKTLSILLITTIISCNSDRQPKHTIPADRWLEIDLYWFDKDDLSASANAFWQRFYPLYEGVGGEKGLIINIGWLMDYVYEWKGNLNDYIPLPKQMHAEKFTDHIPLSGSTEDKMKQWKNRFSTATHEVLNYDNWTYGDLKKLVKILKETASENYNIEGFRIGTLVIAWKNIYGGEESSFIKKHPQTYTIKLKADIFTVLNIEAKLNDDTTSYAAFPEGIKEGMPVYDFFAGQWGSLSKELGLGALILRDSGLGAGIYKRRGPYGKQAPEDPVKVEKYSRATANLVKSVKIANPEALVIGYSNAASAVADWRVNCFDLETIAKEGYLDAFIEQTWAGAWNETGQRTKNFWNHPTLGWTYQLANMLLHAAVLAESKVKHYTLVETFDAWEPWNIIHFAPERLRWGIWAYLHAAVKTPNGLKFPQGTYISWANQGKLLLSEEDVKFLSTHINEANLDIMNTREVYGPTLVYNREAMEKMSFNAPDKSIKEWIDEQAGSIMKWGVPILSVTRMEYLPNVSSDLFVLQTPVNLSDKSKQAISNLIQSGNPIAIWGSPAGGLDENIAQMIGVSSKDAYPSEIKRKGKLVGDTLIFTKDIPSSFDLFHLYSHNSLNDSVNVIYSIDNSPVLFINLNKNKQVIFWDPVDWAENIDYNWNINQPIEKYFGSVYPYVLTARSISYLLKKNNKLYIADQHPLSPVSCLAWKLSDGTNQLLCAELEEGINHNAQNNFKISISFPDSISNNILDKWTGQKITANKNTLLIELQKSQSKLIQIKE